jgi:hypothetical protein
MSLEAAGLFVTCRPDPEFVTVSDRKDSTHIQGMSNLLTGGELNGHLSSTRKQLYRHADLLSV